MKNLLAVKAEIEIGLGDICNEIKLLTYQVYKHIDYMFIYRL